MSCVGAEALHHETKGIERIKKIYNIFILKKWKGDFYVQ
jgi:hypothetical protein